MLARTNVGAIAIAIAIAACHPTGSEPPRIAEAAPRSPVPPGCRSDEADVIARCVDADRYAEDLRAIATPRPPGSQPHLRAQLRCAEVFEAWGYETSIDHYATGTNVIGRRVGSDPTAPYVLVGAHYDHVPGCAGADDNASGVAAVLELARVLAGITPTRSLLFACWDEEERGLVGSRDWAKRARARGDEIFFYVNFDAIAYIDPRPGSQRVPTGMGLLFPTEIARLAEREHRADFIALVTDPAAAEHARAIATFGERDGLPAVVLEVPQLVKDSKIAIDLQRSDHASFWDMGYPAIMITDTADFRSDAYHCRGRPDEVATLTLAFALSVVRATAGAVAVAAARPR